MALFRLRSHDNVDKAGLGCGCGRGHVDDRFKVGGLLQADVSLEVCIGPVSCDARLFCNLDDKAGGFAMYKLVLGEFARSFGPVIQDACSGPMILKSSVVPRRGAIN